MKRTALAALVWLLAACAYIEPIPCEELEWPSAGGPRTYPELCEQGSVDPTPAPPVLYRAWPR